MKRELRERIFTIIVLVLVVTIIAYSWNAHKNGFSPLAVVRGHSMLPLLQEGDLVVLVKASPNEIKPGDIIIYRTSCSATGYIVHRVIAVNTIGDNYYYRTAGDNNLVTISVSKNRVNLKDPTIVKILAEKNNSLLILKLVEDIPCYDSPYGISYSRVVGKVLEIRGIPLKIPYLGYISIALGK